MSDNRVVIKINYDKNKPAKLSAEPKVVTVWHIRRIVVAIFFIVLIVLLLFFWLTGGEKDSQTEPADKVQQLNKTEVEQAESQPLSAIETPRAVTAHKPENNPESVKKTDSVRPPAAIIFSRKVVRASLNTELKDNEPSQQLKAPVSISRNQPTELFYFNEIRGMKNKVLFHQWQKDGHIVQKKQLDIKDNKWKVWSGKTLSTKDIGEWQVQLIDRKGVVYSQINFLVNP
jgi:hypothetical protein